LLVALIDQSSGFGNGFVTFAQMVWVVLFLGFICIGACILSFVAAHGITLVIRCFKPDFLLTHRETTNAEEFKKNKERVALVALDFILQTRLAKEREARRLRRDIEAKALAALTGERPASTRPHPKAERVFHEEIDLTEELAASLEAVKTPKADPQIEFDESRARYWLMCPADGQERFVADFLAPKAGVRGTRWAFCSIGPKYRKTFSRRDAEMWASVLRKERDCLILPANIHARVAEKFRGEHATAQKVAVA
jgi:hypothetical protein